jgi:hypothetical protein
MKKCSFIYLYFFLKNKKYVENHFHFEIITKNLSLYLYKPLQAFCRGPNFVVHCYLSQFTSIVHLLNIFIFIFKTKHALCNSIIVHCNPL